MGADTVCRPCRMEDADDAAVVFRDDLWACEVVPGFDVPGWFVLRVRRHALRIGGLSDRELATYGRRTRDLVGAVAEVTGAPATYVLTFGEAYPHFHSLIAARGDEVPVERRMAAILDQRADRLDRDKALALVPAVMAAYARLAAQSVDSGIRRDAVSTTDHGATANVAAFWKQARRRPARLRRWCTGGRSSATQS